MMQLRVNSFCRQKCRGDAERQSLYSLDGVFQSQIYAGGG